MSMFGTIMSKILGKVPDSPEAAQATPSAQASGTINAAPSATAPTSSSATPGPSLDVAAVLDDLSDKTTEKLDWRHSVVDLMKALVDRQQSRCA
jgi:uncharacterized protein DUF3597